MHPPTSCTSNLLKAVPLWAVILTTVVGYFGYRIFEPKLLDTIQFVARATIAVNVAALVLWAFNRRMNAGLVVAVAWLLPIVYFVGIGPMGAMLLVAAGAIAAGSYFTSRNDSSHLLVALTCGLAMLTAITGWLLPFRVHHGWLYLAALAALICIRRMRIGTMAASVARDLSAVANAYPIATFLLANILGVCSMPLWLPTMQSDDIAYHLALPTQLQLLSYYRMDAAGSIWAMAPWASDVVHSIAQVLAGEESRGAINLLWMVVLYGGVWQLAKSLGLSPRLRFLAVALLASLPLSSSLLAGMQTELPTAALLIVLCMLIADDEELPPRSLTAIAAIAGFILAVKVSNALLLAPAGIWFVVRHWRSIRIWPLMAACFIGAFVAGHSYFYSWLVTGNPVLPFLNGHFKSPYFTPENWTDASLAKEITWALPWDLTFKSSNYSNSITGAAGLLYLTLFAGNLAALFYKRSRPLAIVGMLCFLLVFLQVQYLRYAFPSSALLIVSALYGFHKLNGQRALTTAFVALAVLNLSMYGSSYWHIQYGALQSLVKQGEDKTLLQYAPQRAIASFLRDTDTGSATILFHNVDSQGNAELVKPTLTSSWYNWRLSQEVRDAGGDSSGNRWLKLLQARNVGLIVTHRDKIAPSLTKALESVSAERIHSVANYDVWRFSAVPAPTLRESAARENFARYEVDGDLNSGMLSSRLEFACTLPGEPIVLSYLERTAKQPGEKHLLSKWAMCAEDWKATGLLQIDLPPAEGRSIGITAIPRTPMTFQLTTSDLKLSGSTQTTGTRYPADSIQKNLKQRLSRKNK